MNMSGKKILKLARKNGWKLKRVSGSHHIVVKKDFPPVSIPIHNNKDLPVGLEKKLVRELEIE